ncbi:MAG TPA: flagellar filament capping protein FliD [Bryobacteraceae bacterium]|nr:flagellar filament capping protein FliD [Bryobacteraceae bacterium]
MGSTSSVGSLYFTGLSSYSDDFQSVIQRAVQIAQLPLTKLQNEQADDMNKKAALVALNPVVSNLGSAVAALGTIASGGSLSATSSDSTTVSVVNTGASGTGNYVISNIQSLASVASEMSLTHYANAASTPVSTSGHVNLVVGSNTYQLDLTGHNNLNGLVDAINKANAGVNATILSTDSGNYLSITALHSGATTLQVNDVPQADLISNAGQGTETSLTTYADTTTAPVSTTGKVDLNVGSSTFHLDITGNNNLTGLMNAINSSGAGVTASITGSGPYSLSLTAAGGPVSMQLNDIKNPVNLISNSNQGSNATFDLGGVPEVRSTNTISDIIPGVSFTLQKTDTNGSVTLSLQQDGSQLSSALQTFVNNYNSLVDQVARQIGTSGGPLTGDMLVYTITNDMQQLAGYWSPGSSSIRSLSDLGVTFEDNSGHLTFNANAVDSLSSSKLSDAMKFLGSSSSGFAAFANNFTQLSDPTLGLIRTQENGYDQDSSQLGNQIATLTDRVNKVQATITAQMQAADAMVAQLQSQQNTVNASIQSLNYVLYGKTTNANGL